MTSNSQPTEGTYVSQFEDSLAYADSLIGVPPAVAADTSTEHAGSTEQAALSPTQLWSSIDCADVSEGIHSRLMGMIDQRGGIDEAVLEATRREVDHGAAVCRLRRTLLMASMFDSIRERAESMITDEVSQIEAIMPEMIEAQRAANERRAELATFKEEERRADVEHQERMAKIRQETHSIVMEGARVRAEIQFTTNADQIASFSSQMDASRKAADDRHKAFLESIRGSRW